VIENSSGRLAKAAGSKYGFARRLGARRLGARRLGAIPPSATTAVWRLQRRETTHQVSRRFVSNLRS
jgi:hypothetical protein